MTEETSLRFRRANNEWGFLQILAGANPDLLQVNGREISPEGDTFHFTLSQTWGILAGAAFPAFCTSHVVELLLPRFFPAVPLEVRLITPIFHPNVDPQTGFVCLWDRTSPGDTVVKALRLLQQIIAWQLVNLQEWHVIQSDAARWYADPAREVKLPLPLVPLAEPPSLHEPDRVARDPARRTRPRLSSI